MHKNQATKPGQKRQSKMPQLDEAIIGERLFFLDLSAPGDLPTQLIHRYFINSVQRGFTWIF